MSLVKIDSKQQASAIGLYTVMLRDEKRFSIFVHKNADNDALNSATVLLQYFLEQGIETKFVYLDSNASIKRFSLLKEYKTNEGILKNRLYYGLLKDELHE